MRDDLYQENLCALGNPIQEGRGGAVVYCVSLSAGRAVRNKGRAVRNKGVRESPDSPMSTCIRRIFVHWETQYRSEEPSCISGQQGLGFRVTLAREGERDSSGHMTYIKGFTIFMADHTLNIGIISMYNEKEIHSSVTSLDKFGRREWPRDNRLSQQHMGPDRSSE